jgi:hypothetical protein
MKTASIKFTVRCQVCGHVENHRLTNMGESHAATIRGYGSVWPGWRCSGCKDLVSANLYGVEIEIKERTRV